MPKQITSYKSSTSYKAQKTNQNIRTPLSYITLNIYETILQPLWSTEYFSKRYYARHCNNLSASVVILEKFCRMYLEFNTCKRTMGLKWFEIMR
jgi:hypothetical protein